MGKTIKIKNNLPVKKELSQKNNSIFLNKSIRQLFLVSSTFAYVALPAAATSTSNSESNVVHNDSLRQSSDQPSPLFNYQQDQDKYLNGSKPLVTLSPDEQARTPTTIQNNNQATVSGSSLALDQLDQIGRIWISEAPALLVPKLSLSAPAEVVLDDKQIKADIVFNLFCNYTAFIKKAEIYIYAPNDNDRIKPLAVIPVAINTLNNQQSISWSGVLAQASSLQVGQYLSYSVRVYDAEGRWDETFAKKIKLVSAQQNSEWLNQQKNNTDLIIHLKSQEAGLSLEEYSNTLSNYGNDQLIIQNIPLLGSSVKLRGQDIEPGYEIRINQQPISIDTNRQFTAEYLLPVGEHEFKVEAVAANREIAQTLKTRISGEHFFMVGLADLTFSKNTYSGALEAVNAEDYERFTGHHTDARLAFYLKAKIKGKYLLTAQADTQEKDIHQLFDRFFKADRTDIFRAIDPEQYYPIYGDDAIPIQDIDTSGRLYVRLDWDKSYINWGNVRTEFDSNKIASFNRNLYGAKIVYRSLSTQSLGEPRSQLKAIAAHQQTAPGRSEFLGTGGSLYYLHHTDIVPQSEKLILQVREKGTDRIKASFDLKAGRDYELDAFQGRILLTRPLQQINKDNALLEDFTSAYLENILVSQYEYYPSNWDTENLTAGFSTKQWLGDHVAVGANHVKENRSGQDFELAGLDLTLQAGAGTWLKVEQARSKSTLASRFFSSDGGLQFNEIKAQSTDLKEGAAQEGEAFSIEARLNTQELEWTENPWKSAFWIKQRSPQFSSESISGAGKQTTDKGIELIAQVSPEFQWVLSYKTLDNKIQNKVTVNPAAVDLLEVKTSYESLSTAKVGWVWQASENWNLQSQLQYLKEEKSLSSTSEAGLIGLQLTRHFSPDFQAFLFSQNSFAHQNYAPNNALGMGLKYSFYKGSNLTVDYTQGDRGQSISATTDLQLSSKYSIFGSYSYTPNTSENSLTDYFITSRSFTEQTSWTVGQRLQLNDQIRAVTETRLQQDQSSNALIHHLGFEYAPTQQWNLGLSFQNGKVENPQSQAVVQRESVSLSAAYNHHRINAASKLEYRSDASLGSNTADTHQWLTSNRLTYQLTENWRVIAKLNYSKTQQDLLLSKEQLISNQNNRSSVTQATWAEANLGFAWRPTSGRWSVLAKYGYLYDLAPLGQQGNNRSTFDQESHIVSVEANYELNRQIDLAGKIAQRKTLTRLERGQGPWFSNNATYAAAQVKLKLRGLLGDSAHTNSNSSQSKDDLWSGWAILSEYRALKTENDGFKKGAVISIEKDINKYQKISVGYNFSDFSSDISQLSYKSKGFFINFVGRF